MEKGVNKIPREKSSQLQVPGSTRSKNFVSNHYLVFIRNLPLPLRERDGVRGIEMKSLDILNVITPTLTLPPQRGRGIPGFPDGN